MNGIININGVIGLDVVLKDVVTQATSQKGVSGFTVNLNSLGGNVIEGRNIYNYLRSLGLPIEMVGSQNVASVATVVFMAGDVRRLERGTNFFIHLPNVPRIENATAEHLEEYSKELRKIESQIIDFYITNTNLTKEAIEPMLKEETFLSEEELFAMGFTTKQSYIQVEAVAFLDNNINLKNKEMATENEKANSIISQIKNFLNGTDAEMKILLTADQKELEFAQVDEDAEIQLGDSALLDGANVSGDVVLADGRILKFSEGGKLEEIIDVVIEDEEMIALKEENEALKTQLTDKVEAIKLVEAKLEEGKKVLKNIEKLQSQMLADDKKEKKETKKEPSNDLSDSVAKLMTL